MYKNCYKNKKVIVTGNTGFKGAWLTIWLIKLGAKVVGISKDIPTDPSIFEELKLNHKIEHYFENICDLDKVKKIIIDAKPDYIFNLAAQPIVSKSYEDPIETFNTNVIGTLNILESLKFLSNKCKAIMITSDKCYNNIEQIWGYKENDRLGGLDPYSASKASAELVIRTFVHSYFNEPDSNIKIVSVRAGNVIGGGDWALNRIVPDCIKAWASNQPVSIRNPYSTRPWQHVLEPLSGYLRVGQLMNDNKIMLKNGEPYNFGPNSDQNHTVLELLEQIKVDFKAIKIKKYFNIDSNSSFHEAGLLKLNCDKALFQLQWKPVLNFKQTAFFTSKWYDNYYNNEIDLYDFTENQIDEYYELAKIKSISWAI